ncbi:Glycosyltransferase involved in cell wall bisynthesis [Halopelagius inordinatus]|uniref:Glycosyltransferase involved in cell wall bisynthesis n=1 Tax=Halopelagius inordinatus TaxID=553467 RepID=A0A1I2P0J4_9EURY|nr:glycosyltransferase family 4 protein [Halopelagius inordinatus]SFG09765.1 Glycosyltransferase involved in cell wall bisynthesis [Halopelagius inordinatus]
MRVGLLIYGPLDGRSGGYRYDLELATRLRADGDAVEVVSLPERSYARRFADNASRTLRRRLAAADFDVLVQDELCHPSLLWTNRRVDFDYPVVSLVHHLRSAEPHHGLRTNLYRTVEARYLRGVDAFVCSSEATRRTISELTDPNPSVVAYPAGDRFDADVTPGRVRARASADPLRVVAVGSVTPRKNVETLVRGLSRVSSPWELTVVGDLSVAPGHVARLRRLVAETGTSDRVRFAGRLADAELASVFERSHVFALPSTYEGFGIVYAEAMGFGLPVVASQAGGASELVTDGRDGFLVDPAEPSDVTDAISVLARNRTRLAAMGVAARETHRSHPTWDETAARVRDFLATLV